MKTQALLSTVCILLGLSLSAQQAALPPVTLTSIDGISVKASDIKLENKPVLMIFWYSYDPHCCSQIDEMDEVYRARLGGMDFQLIGICCDQDGDAHHVKPLVNGKNWDMKVYIDKNGEFKRAMGVSECPYTILFDQDQEVVCKYFGYCAGIDDMLCEKIRECYSLAATD
jgi:hypothetical protein